jgi:hypothetical protein
MTIAITDVGNILNEINKAEIPFRFENLVAIGFRWAVVGHDAPEPGEMNLYRAEIDDGIQGTLEYLDKVPDKLRFLGFKQEHFSVENANEQLKSLHIMQKDWLERGEAYDIITAITELTEAVCKHYPESDFTRWFQDNFRNGQSQSA